MSTIYYNKQSKSLHGEDYDHEYIDAALRDGYVEYVSGLDLCDRPYSYEDAADDCRENLEQTECWVEAIEYIENLFPDDDSLELAYELAYAFEDPDQPLTKSQHNEAVQALYSHLKQNGIKHFVPIEEHII